MKKVTLKLGTKDYELRFNIAAMIYLEDEGIDLDSVLNEKNISVKLSMKLLKAALCDYNMTLEEIIELADKHSNLQEIMDKILDAILSANGMSREDVAKKIEEDKTAKPGKPKKK